MTDAEALASIITTVQTAWMADVPAIADPNPYTLLRAGKERTGGNPAGYWARIVPTIVVQPLASFADENTFGAHKKRYQTYGFVTVQVFAPKSFGSDTKGRQIGEVIRDAFRADGQRGDVGYSNSRINRLPDDGGSWRFNVICDFRYDTIG